MAEPGPRPTAQLSPRARWLLFGLFAVLITLSARLYGARPERTTVEFSGAIMGTTWSVKLAGDPGAEAQRHAAREISARLERVDGLMSTWKPESELSRFNAHDGTDAFAISRETAEVFAVAQAVSERSGGAFDVTVGPLVEAWGFGRSGRRDEAPSTAELDALRGRIGYTRLRLSSDPPSLRKSQPALAADLSAVAKGYAVDEVARALAALGHEAYLVEIGGELRASGTHEDGAPWRVAIEAPASASDAERRAHHIVELREQALATSGDYRNYFEEGGRRISHTIDPRSGHPIEHRLASVSVLHAEAVWADAWATALSVLGPEAGLAAAEREGLAAYFIVRALGDTERFDTRMTAAFREQGQSR